METISDDREPSKFQAMVSFLFTFLAELEGAG